MGFWLLKCHFLPKQDTNKLHEKEKEGPSSKACRVSHLVTQDKRTIMSSSAVDLPTDTNYTAFHNKTNGIWRAKKQGPTRKRIAGRLRLFLTTNDCFLQKIKHFKATVPHVDKAVVKSVQDFSLKLIIFSLGSFYKGNTVFSLHRISEILLRMVRFCILRQSSELSVIVTLQTNKYHQLSRLSQTGSIPDVFFTAYSLWFICV